MFESPRQTRSSARAVIVAFAATGLMMTASAQARAQASSGQQAAPQQSAQQTVASADVPDADVTHFAKSMTEVLGIQQKVQQQAATEQDPAKVQQLKRQANVDMVKAIEKDGLKVERYNLIARSMVKDAQLKQRIDDARKKLQGGGNFY